MLFCKSPIVTTEAMAPFSYKPQFNLWLYFLHASVRVSLLTPAEVCTALSPACSM